MPDLRICNLPIIIKIGSPAGMLGSYLQQSFAHSERIGTGWDLKETLQHLWHYRALLWARTFLGYWCVRAMRSRLEPIKKVARMLRAHEELCSTGSVPKQTFPALPSRVSQQQDSSGDQKIVWVSDL